MHQKSRSQLVHVVDLVPVVVVVVDVEVRASPEAPLADEEDLEVPAAVAGAALLLVAAAVALEAEAVHQEAVAGVSAGSCGYRVGMAFFFTFSNTSWRWDGLSPGEEDDRHGIEAYGSNYSKTA